MTLPRIAGAALAALALALTGCAATAEPAAAPAADSGPAGLLEAGVVTVCIDPEYPPLEYYENGTDGEIIGFDADAARAVAAHWGVELAFEVSTFEGLQPGVQTGRCDFIPGGLYMSEERLAVLDGVQYMQTGPGLIVRADDDTDYTTEADLCGLTIVTQSGGTNAEIAQGIAADCGAGTETAHYPKTADTVVAIMNGNGGALIETDVAAADIVSRSGGVLRLVDGFFPRSTQFGMFLQKDSPLTAPLAEALAALGEDGTLAEIAETYNLDPTSIAVG